MGGPGSGGSNRKAAHLHLVQGTFRADRHGAGDGVPQVGTPQKTPPKWLDARGRWFWRHHAPLCVEMGTLDGASSQLFGQLCAQWSAWRAAAEQLDLEGHTIKTKRGIEPHPVATICDRYARRVHQLAGEFGLTPLGRKRLGITQTQAEKDEATKSRFDGYGDGSRASNK